MGMFDCKVCAEKEKRIRELKDQIHYLRSLTIPSNDYTENHTNPYEDVMVETVEEPSPDPEMEAIRKLDETDKAEAELQADAMLSGTY